MKKLFLVIVAVFLTGCEKPSMNMQRSAARGAGDTGITAYLDDRDTNDIDERKARIIMIVNEVEGFLNEGEIGSLTVDALQKQVNKIVPAEYQDLSDTILEYLSDFETPTEKIPENVVRNIKEALNGIRTGVYEYKIEDRKNEQDE